MPATDHGEPPGAPAAAPATCDGALDKDGSIARLGQNPLSGELDPSVYVRKILGDTSAALASNLLVAIIADQIDVAREILGR